jgi:peptidoglycan/LPS O-acetylase OafA/YrhL
VLQWPVMQWLGKISYSIYLVHMLVFYAVQYAVMALYPTIAKPAFLAVMLVGVVGGTIALSMFSYRFVEMPGIQAGRRVGAWFGAQGAPRFS